MGSVVRWFKGSFALCRREWLRFGRQPSRLVATVATPLLFWLFLGLGLGSALPTGESSYLAYFFPGGLCLLILFASIFSSISLIEDRNQGFLQGVLTSPLPRSAIVFGKVLGGSTLATVQACLLLPAVPLMGFRLTVQSWLVLLVGIWATSLALTALGFLFAWRFNSVQGFHGVMNLVLVPMWLLSGSFFPLEKATVWLKPLMYANPLTYALEGFRISLGTSGGTAGLSVWGSLMAVLGFGLLCFLGSVFLVERERGV